MKNTKYKGHIDAVVKYFYPVAAGIETNMLETYSAMVKKGWNITIHTTKDTHNDKNILTDQLEIRGLHVKRYPYEHYAFIPQIDLTNTNIVCLHNFDILPHLLFLAKSWIKKIAGKKDYQIVVTPHGGFTPEWSVFPFWMSTVKYILHVTVGSFLINRVVDKVRAVSEWEKREIIRYGIKPEKVTTITNGIEDEAYMDLEKLASEPIKQKVKELGRYIIQIGRIYPIKNYETTIRALAETPKDTNYVIIGQEQFKEGEEYLAELKKLISDLKLENRVHFLGVIRGVDKYFLIKHAQMMVHMAIWESFCNVVHEGLSQGLVCIVSNNTALPLLIKDGINGYCIETHDYKGVANKINYVLKNKTSKEIKDMENRNRIYGLKNSWRNVADTVDQWFI